MESVGRVLRRGAGHLPRAASDGSSGSGTRCPHPAILFLVLCGAVIVLSQALYWAQRSATFEVVKPPAVPTEQTYYGGSSEPTDVGPTEPVPPDAYEVTTETAKVKDC